MQTIPIDPDDFGADAVDFGIPSSARQHIRIPLDGEDAVPAPGARERDGVSARAGKGVDEDCFRGWCALRDVVGDFTFGRGGSVSFRPDFWACFFFLSLCGCIDMGRWDGMSWEGLWGLRNEV